MKTRKIFYEDAYVTNFQAEVVKNGEDYIVLSETAFYPTGGGQPCDIGSIAGIPVLYVEELDGEIRHFMSEPPPIGTKVTGQVNWERRFDHMQQHLGQHILSAAFVELTTYETIGFHLGTDIVTIDINHDDLTDEQLQAVEARANQIILDHRPVITQWLTKEEAETYPLRKALAVKDDVRLVIIPEFDYNGCGGTHPRFTSEVQGIKILGFERQKKKLRISFVCGQRILAQLEKKTKVLSAMTELLNAPLDRLEDACVKVIERNKQVEKDLKGLLEQLYTLEATSIAEKAKDLNGKEIIAQVFAGYPITALQSMAKTIAVLKPDAYIFLVTENSGKGQFVASRGQHTSVQLKDWAKQIFARYDAKGGGNEVFVQGGVELGTLKKEQLLTEMVDLFISIE